MKKLICILWAAVFCAALLCTSMPVLHVWATEVEEGEIGKHPAESSEIVSEVSSEVTTESSQAPAESEVSSAVSSEETSSSSSEESSSEASSEASSETSSEVSSEVSSAVSSETSSEVSSTVSSETSSETSSAVSSESSNSSVSETVSSEAASSAPVSSEEPSSSQVSSEVSSAVSSEETSSQPDVTTGAVSSEDSADVSSDAEVSEPETGSSDITVGPVAKPQAPNRFLLYFGIFLIVAGFIGLIFFIGLQIVYARRNKKEAVAAAVAEPDEVDLNDAAFKTGAVYAAADDADSDLENLSDEELDARLAAYESQAKNTRVNGNGNGGKYRPRH